MSVAFFVSGSGGNLKAALDSSRNCGLYRISIVIADRPNIRALAIAEKCQAPTIVRDFEAECGSWQEASKSPKGVQYYQRRAVEFHDEILETLLAYETSSGQVLDIAVLSYRRWIHGRLLVYFANRMINQHPGDLTVRADAGGRRYVGLSAVWRALSDGKQRTRTTTFLVGKGHDTGEILCQGSWTGYTGTWPVTKDQARVHELRQKEISDWPSIRFALREIAMGRFSLSLDRGHSDGSRIVQYASRDLPYGGVDLDPSNLCHGGVQDEPSFRADRYVDD